MTFGYLWTLLDRMCGTIDHGSCIRWVLGFGIKTGVWHDDHSHHIPKIVCNVSSIVGCSLPRYSEGSAQPLISSGTIPRNQRRSSTRCVECKEANELSSLVPLPCTLFHLCMYSHQPNATTQMGEPDWVPTLRGYPDYCKNPPHIIKSLACSFSKVWRSTMIARHRPLKFSRLRRMTWLTNTKRKVNKRQWYLDFVKLSFIWVSCVHESKRKTKMTQLPPLLLFCATRRATSNRQRDERC
jgi:hypothetical protein